MKKRTKNPALLFIMTMFAFMGMLSVEASEPDYGGAIYNESTKYIEADSSFTGYTAYKKGGAIYTSGTMNIGNNVSFTGNYTTWDGAAGSGSDTNANGGAIWNSGNLTIGDNATFTDNHTSYNVTSGSGHGSDIYNNGGTITIGDNLKITRTDSFGNNHHDCAIFVNGGTLNIQNNALIENVREAIVTNTSAIVNIGDGLTVKNTSNGIASWGKEVNIGNNATFENIVGDARVFQTVTDTGIFTFGDGLVVKDNMTLSFGNIYNDKYNTSMTFNGKADFINNSAQLDNAGVFQNWGALYFNGATTFQGNTAYGVAGALRNRGTDSISEFADTVIFANNAAKGNAGAIQNQGKLTFNNKAIFTGNTAGALTDFVENEKGFFDDREDPETHYSWNATGVDASTSADGGAIYNETTDNINGIVTFNSDVTFSGNQASGNGGAIYNAGTLKFENSTEEGSSKNVIIFENNTATNGGAIYNQGAIDSTGNPITTAIENATFTNNIANGGNAGAIYNLGELYIKDSTFANNSSTKRGGAIYNKGNMTIDNAIFDSNNCANQDGGAIFVDAGTVNILNSKFVNNKAVDADWGADSGAISLKTGKMTIDNTVFEGNKAIWAGAIYQYANGENVKLTIQNSQFNSNEAQAIGAVGVFSNAIIQNTEFNGNLSTSTDATNGGGAVFAGSSSKLTINNTVFNNNVSNASGGAIMTRSQDEGDNVNATLDISQSDFIGNKAELNGGAINNNFYNSENTAGYVSVDESTFINNSANNGGAIYNSKQGSKCTEAASIMISNSTFENNIATANGGAIYNDTDAELVINNSVFKANQANGITNDIYNDGYLNLQGNVELDGGINGTGIMTVDRGANVDIHNGTLIQEEVGIGTNAKLIANVSKTNVEDAIINLGTLELTGSGLISTKIIDPIGSGKLILSPTDVFIYNDSSLISGTMPINVTGGELKIGNAISNLTNEFVFENATLNIMNGVPNTILNLNVAEDKTLQLALDFGDVIESQNMPLMQGDISITSLDISSLTGDSQTTLTSTLGKYIELSKDINLIQGGTTFNYVKINKLTPESADASLYVARSSLNGAVTDPTESRLYSMTDNETIVANTTVGELIIQGNGATITSNPSDIGGGIEIGTVGTDSSSLALVDTNLDSIIVRDDNKGALTVNGDNGLLIEAKNHDVVIQNTQGNTVNNAIYLNDSSTGLAKAALNANAGKSITIQDDIRSNNANNTLYLMGDGDIHLNGVLDPATVITTASNVYRNSYDEAITWNLLGGTVHYSKDDYLYNAAHHSGALMNTLNFYGGSLDLRNGSANTINLAALNLYSTSNLYLDVDLANKKMDRFEAPVTVSGGTLNVAGLQLLSDSLQPETNINFTTDAALKDKVQYTGVQGLQALSPIYKYNVKYLADSGDFNFVRNVAPNPYQSYNPAIYGSSVAMQGVYTTQLANYDTAFSNLDQKMLMTKAQRNALKYGNKYAANDETNPQVYSPLFIPEENAGIWFRPYASFEQVQLDNGPDVNNVMYGSLVGGDTEILDIGRGWDAQFSVYAGYNGSHQTFDGVGIYQNGGMAGLTAALYRGNFFEALTANFGANCADIKSNIGSNDFTTLATGIASKTGYNWELAKGKFIIQPSWTMSYTFIAPLDNYTLSNGVRIKTDNLNAIQLAPAVKFIGNLPNGWQPYLNFRMLWNIIDDTKVKAGFVNLPETSVKPYFEYGLGVQKTVGERFTGFGQAMFKAGGRNGVSFTLGARYALGELKDKHQEKNIKKSSETLKLKKISVNQ